MRRVLRRPSLDLSTSVAQRLRLPADVPRSSLSVIAQLANGSGGAEVLVSVDLLLLALVFKSLVAETFVITRTVAPLWTQRSAWWINWPSWEALRGDR